jgi:hypothetical protein
MSDFNEYYKKAWELGLMDQTAVLREAESRGFDLAVQMLREYRPETEEVRSCLHSTEWAAWLETKRPDTLKGKD